MSDCCHPPRPAAAAHSGQHAHPAGHAHASHHQARPGAAPPPSRAGTRYTCPMHPEILRDAPGD